MHNKRLILIFAIVLILSLVIPMSLITVLAEEADYDIVIAADGVGSVNITLSSSIDENNVIVEKYNYSTLYNNEKVPYSAKNTAEGKTIITYPIGIDDILSYRINNDNKITRAGYIKYNDTEPVKIKYAEKEYKNFYYNYMNNNLDNAIKNNKESAEDSMLLNVNKKNFLKLAVGETFNLKAFRTTQIINNANNNFIIEPDFKFQVIKGDSVEVIKTDISRAELKAVKSGISYVKVNYDAIEIFGESAGIYGASDVNRTGLIAVSVDGDSGDIDVGLPINWDSEFDTYYFTGENGEINLTPSAADGISEVKVGGKIITPINGVYTATVNAGTTAIEVRSGDKVACAIFRAAKLNYEIQNLSKPNSPIVVGNKVGIKFKKIYNPIPKLAGIYNARISMGSDDEHPGVRIYYNDGTYTSKYTQNDIVTDNIIEFIADNPGTVRLSGGLIEYGGYSPFRTHRTIDINGKLNTADAESAESLQDIGTGYEAKVEESQWEGFYYYLRYNSILDDIEVNVLQVATDEMKTNSINDITEYKSANDYLPDEQTLLEEIIEKYTLLINEAMYKSEIIEYANKARAEMDSLKTAAEYAEEAAIFENYKTAALSEIRKAFDLGNYRVSERAEIEKLLEEYEIRIGRAVDTKEVDKIKIMAMADLGSIKTAVELASDKNKNIVLGICIPIGLIVVAAGVFFVLKTYRKRAK